MGLTVYNYTLYNGNVTLPSVYANVRNIRTTKEVEIRFNTDTSQNISTDIFKFEFIVNYTLNDNTINTNFISEQTETGPYVGDLWSLAYEKLRTKLDNLGLTHSDDI